MTEAAVERHLGATSEYRQAPLLVEWTKASKRAGEKARRRNQLAHGATFKEQDETGKEKVSFVPFLNQIMAGHQVMVSGGAI